MRKLIGYATAMLMTAALGAGCAETQVIEDDTQRLHHEVQVMEWKLENMERRNAALKRQIDAYNDALDARDIAFYSTRIPGARSASFQE